jgi:D-alanyl-D-alanine dipeptidase/L,D-peptidoglycan transpeptidase YkuD (ErfK/YbiS/YcfS/YnhG family)
MTGGQTDSRQFAVSRGRSREAPASAIFSFISRMFIPHKIWRLTAALLAAACLFAAPSHAWPPGFVDIADMIPEAKLDIRYYGDDNFTGSRIDSYEEPLAALSVEAAAALKRAARILERGGYGVKIYDAYRPERAVKRFVRWGRDLNDVKMKKKFYPDIDKANLFKEGYIASKSGHSRGGAVDLTITDASSGLDIDMGSPFDFFGEISHPASKQVTAKQSANRKILRDAMIQAGFAPIRTEWWHFILKNEPYPKTYFDFPVARPEPADAETSATLSRAAEGADKIITVVPAAGKKSAAIARAYKKTEKGWTLRFETAGYLGRNGVADDKIEGDGKTPSGVYTFGRAFGAADDPGSNTPYTKLTENDVWVDDPKSTRYNQWADKSAPGPDWESAEHLIKFPKAYKYAIAVNYNANPVIPGKGSAIFLHCSEGRPTAGCVSVPESAAVFFLSFIDEKTRIDIRNR